ncbi:hypothetical protein J5N97_012207 [Dioscorea zingiberensis]|uniref:BZIP domain-containing protein n=1 Tax=Dioscorea zingiberensis TaxID=325984 RepID=A0A9D5CR25_9LILI|nr:hypothetical protein J5N97_012207 [Dioscorea zingiberensis]
MGSDESRGSAEEQVKLKREKRQLDEREEDVELAFPLMRQSSIYSLTLDEIQNAVCEPGKTFGSMNMDEFLANIWSVEEGQGQGQGNAPSFTPAMSAVPPSGSGGGLQRQGSITIPAPLSRKTVDEVWSEIHRGQQQQQHQNHHQNQQHTFDNLNPPTPVNPSREPTFGEMTLEDFLIKAGVVREGYNEPPTPTPAQAATPPTQQYGLPSFQMGVGEGPGYGHVMAVGLGPAASNGMYSSGYAGVVNGKRGGGGGEMYYGGGHGGCNNGYGAGVGSPTSPVSSDGMGNGQVDNVVTMEVGARGGRKRSADGAVEKVVERRQRRMIKNRESAARSRARKQAYTVELEAELNQLKEENARLRDEERQVMDLRKQLLIQAMAEQSRSTTQPVRKLRHSSIMELQKGVHERFSYYTDADADDMERAQCFGPLGFTKLIDWQSPSLMYPGNHEA